jgi:hypothetical protein
MRLKFVLCGVTTLMPALLLTGCGMDQMSSVMPNVVSAAVMGRSFGGQQPVVGATISVVEMGTSGYGSTGIVLASTLTDANGNFSFAPGAYTCPQSDTPVYLLGIGGNAGSGNNGSAVEAAALGTCTNGKNSFVVMNEVTTAATAFVLSHFFSTTLGGVNGANDWFGGPSTTSGTTVYSQGLVMGSEVTLPTIVSNALGQPNQSGNGYTVEWQKINSIANTLAACINSSGSTSSSETRTPCGKLFNWTSNGATTRPSDTLQAAVQMALFPTTQVNNLFNLQTPQAPFAGLPTPPNDWTIGVGYTSSAVGLAVDTGTLSTLDIDASGRIWFPSNAAGKAGAAYFDPVGQSFNGPFNSTSLVHPQQVAIDANGFAWYNDSAATTVAGYMISAPMTTQTASLPATTSNSLTVGGDDRINVGVTNASVFRLANISADRTSFSLAPGISFIFPVASMAGDIANGDAVTISNPVTTQMRSYYVSAVPAATDIVNSNDDSGQVIYTGNDYISVRSYSGTGNNNDALCIYSQARCFNVQGVTKNTGQGIAIDGGKNLWVAESSNGGVVQVPINSPTGTDGAIYLNPSGANNVPNNEFLHGTGNGGTATMPYGIGVDATGNVWVTNAGCSTNDCAPGSFTLTEIVGAGFPTITPVSAQITGGNLVGTEPTH